MEASQIVEIQQAKSTHSSLRWAAEHDKWFQLKPYINDSKECSPINKVKGGVADLGNRRPNYLGLIYKVCLWCHSIGIQINLDKLHVILDCPGSGYARRVKSKSLS